MPHDAASPGWLTTTQAAAYLGYRSPQAIRALIHRGALVPDGRRGAHGAWLFRRVALDAWAALRSGAPAPTGVPGQASCAALDGMWSASDSPTVARAVGASLGRNQVWATWIWLTTGAGSPSVKVAATDSQAKWTAGAAWCASARTSR